MRQNEAPVGRRVFLGLLGVGVAGVLVGARVDDWLERTLGPVEARDPTGLLSLLPIGRFRIYSVAASLPSRSHADYRLKVGGLVERPRTLTYADLRTRPATSLTRDFQCVTGWRVHNVAWTGVKLRDLLDDAGVKANATAVRFTSFDGVYSESLTLEQARRDDVLVAYRLEGSDLSRQHGGPVRLAVTPMYGYKSLKWLDTIEVTADVEPGYWEHRGYDVNGWVGHSNGRSDDPTA
ncbi:MAG TPA: molybdopterin-dependent oxidoreductase [Acidimicrobiia bacterium]|jgi:DMSO/TMAO reductase YedYZ molybdopterin-dependent catalytic subunit|nr:molybdopterin-dependent oxidoreductase [Acidimicrobiia bacterium]